MSSGAEERMTTDFEVPVSDTLEEARKAAQPAKAKPQR